VFKEIVGGLDAAAKIADKGAGYWLLACGILVLIATLTLKFTAVTEGMFLKAVPLSTADLGILVGAAVLLFWAGAGVRMWDSYLIEKALEREERFRIEAAQKAFEAASAISKDFVDATRQNKTDVGRKTT